MGFSAECAGVSDPRPTRKGEGEAMPSAVRLTLSQFPPSQLTSGESGLRT